MGRTRIRNDADTKRLLGQLRTSEKELNRMLSAAEVAERLGVTVQTLGKQVARGAFPPPTNKAVEAPYDDRARASWQRTQRKWSRKLIDDFISGKLLAVQANCTHKFDWAGMMIDGL